MMTSSDFATAYDHGFASTVRFLLATGVPPDTADDVAQAGWARGWERRDQLKEPIKVVGWVNRISLNLFRNRLRHRRPTEEVGDVPSRPGTNATTIDVRRCLDRCTADDEELLRSYYLEGYTSRELGLREHCSAGAIRVRVLRARRRFMASLNVDAHRSQAHRPVDGLAASNV